MSKNVNVWEDVTLAGPANSACTLYSVQCTVYTINVYICLGFQHLNCSNTPPPGK